MYYILSVVSYLFQLFTYISFFLFFAYIMGSQYYPKASWFKKIESLNMWLIFFLMCFFFIVGIFLGISATNMSINNVLKTGDYQQVCGRFDRLVGLGGTIKGNSPNNTHAIIILNNEKQKYYRNNDRVYDIFSTLNQGDKVCIDYFTKRRGLLLEKYDYPLKVHKR